MCNGHFMQKYNKGSILILSSTNYYRQKKPVVFLFFILVRYAKKTNGSVLRAWIVSISRIICKRWKEIEGNYNMNRFRWWWTQRWKNRNGPTFFILALMIVMTRLDNWIVWKSSLFSSSYSCDVLSRLVTVMNINEKC